jgi:hypothetical protein
VEATAIGVEDDTKMGQTVTNEEDKEKLQQAIDNLTDGQPDGAWYSMWPYAK